MTLDTPGCRQSSLQTAGHHIGIFHPYNKTFPHLTLRLGLEVRLLRAEGVRRGVGACHQEVNGIPWRLNINIISLEYFPSRLESGWRRKHSFHHSIVEQKNSNAKHKPSTMRTVRDSEVRTVPSMPSSCRGLALVSHIALSRQE